MERVKIDFTLNGRAQKAEVKPDQTLLAFLREELGLTGTKCGCEIGECGACTVLINGEAVNSCLVLAAQIHNYEIWTVEGANKNDRLQLLEKAFIAEHAVQCGYCTPGMLLAAAALLEKTAHPTEKEIRRAISGNLCRCTGYIPIIKAVEKVAADAAVS